jgi:hypothetical protein
MEVLLEDVFHQPVGDECATDCRHFLLASLDRGFVDYSVEELRYGFPIFSDGERQLRYQSVKSIESCRVFAVVP